MSIRDTATEAMRSAGLSTYARQAEPVFAALEEREANAVRSLIGFATAEGLSEEDAREAIEEAGLTVPAATATGQTAEALALEERLRRMEASLNGALTFARQHGYRG